MLVGRNGSNTGTAAMRASGTTISACLLPPDTARCCRSMARVYWEFAVSDVIAAGSDISPAGLACPGERVDHASGQGLVSRAGRDEGRPGGVLPAGGRAAAAGDGRAPGAAAAVPRGRGRAVVLPEAGARERPGLA